MITYKLFLDHVTNEPSSVLRSDGWSIPFDPANTDAVEFAKWMQEGNRPEPAEEGGAVTDEWVAETIARLLPDSQE